MVTKKSQYKVCYIEMVAGTQEDKHAVIMLWILQAWVETQLAAALSSVQRSTNAARMATMMITQATAVLAAP